MQSDRCKSFREAAMRPALLKTFLKAFAAVAISAFAATAALAQSDQNPSHEERMKHALADRETMFHARVAGMKSALGLAREQEKFWNPFEAALNDLSAARTDTMKAMMKEMAAGDRMAMMADRMAVHAGKMQMVAAAGKPLYGSLNDDQKHKFEVLSHGLMASGPEGVYAPGGGAGFSWEPQGWE
jgi:hypothetical protein